jgi:crotonobetainyl-CoA:carnitine CoA-transferase CaiB-like acyl-CoA transferase
MKIDNRAQRPGPLIGVRILDISSVIAGPLSATLLADFGADVLKIELPRAGDPIRSLPPHKDGVALWSKVVNRNKRGITLDLRRAEGRELLERLLPKFDVLIENFRSGTLAKWGLDASRLWAINPSLIILRVTGFGQTGPYRDRPGFARIFEAMSGFVNLCGQPDGPPTYPGFPVSDSVAGIFGALSIAAALRARDVSTDRRGQEIDLSATEAMFRVLDFTAVEFDQLGNVRSRTGNRNAYSAPGDLYQTADGEWIALAVSAPSVFARLATAIGRRDVLDDPKFSTNVARLKNRDEIEEIVRSWFRDRSANEALQILHAAEVSASKIYSIADIFKDPHFAAREAIVAVDDSELGTIKMQAVVPKFSETPGAVQRTGPTLGEHNREVFCGELGLSDVELVCLKANGIV